MMTLKGFLHKAQGKAANSAMAFIAAHKEFILTGELGALTGPILIRLDNREIMPTPALSEIKTIVLSYMLAQQVLNVPKDPKDPKAPKEPKAPTKQYTGEVYDLNKTVMYNQDFDAHIRAQDWVERRLVLDSSNGWTGKVIDNCNLRETIIDRNVSFQKILKGPKSPSMKKVGGGDGKWRMRAVGDHCNFSRG